MELMHRIIFGDCRRMDALEDRSVHLVVTSPPYWQLKDYGSEGQIGYASSYEDYVNDLNLVWQECDRVLHPGCRLCVNIGDQFARAAVYGRYKVIPIRTEIVRFCETIGLDYMGALIWQKATTVNTTGGGVVMGSFPHPRNGIVKIDYEFILLFRKPGGSPKVSAAVKEASALTPEEWNLYFQGHWTFPGEKQRGHLAMFPEELPGRLIRMFSFEGETVLDPFAGCGTTALAALNRNRDSVGYEIQSDYEEAIGERLGERAREMTFRRQEPLMTAAEVNARRATLPYLFRDPVQLSAKVDPKLRSAGSKIDGTERPTDTARVVSVPGPTRVLLDDGREIRLLGVSAMGEKAEEAQKFLERMAKGKRVRITDEVDGSGYIYLTNRTFLNGQLVRKGLARADRTADHRHAARFLRYEADRRD
jgi:site-specific DNA-methyltransferase (adenine-specific)